MSTTAWIILAVIVALILIGLLVLMPRMRAKAQEKKAARELAQRRERVATEHREEAGTRATRAEEAERKAAIAQQNAAAERAEAERHEQEAQLHERGLADDNLIDDHERDRFQGVAGGNDATRGDDDRVADGSRGEGNGVTGATREDTAARQAGNTEYEQGRRDEATERETRR